MIKLFFIFVFFLSFANSNIVLKNDIEKVENFSIDYIYDKSRKLTIDDISNMNFQEKTSSQFTFGHTEGNFWFKLSIENQSKNNEFILYINEPLFEEANFFKIVENAWVKHPNGLLVDIDTREIKDSNPTFIFKIDQGDTQTYYIQLFAKNATFGEIEIYQKDKFLFYSKISNFTLYIFYFGSLFIVIIYNLFLYIKFKEKIYGYYVGYIVFYFIFVFAFSGLDIYIGLAPWHYYLDLSIPILTSFFILFSNELLDIKKYLPKLYKLMNALVFILIFLLPLIIIKFDPWFEVSVVIVSFTSVLLLFISIYIFIKGHIEAKYYVLALSVYMFTLILLSFMTSGLLPNNNITHNSFLFGSLFEITIFSLILANRFHKNQNEKIKMKNELIDIKTKNEEFLENEILIRTKKISTINKQLREMVKEKEHLLKEVYHRVKNNFQIISSMLGIEANKKSNKEDKKSFMELTNRIKSMSFVHQLLYSSKTLSQIQSKDYLLKIIDEVKKVYVDKDVVIHKNIDSYELNMDESIVLGIIINEILSNSIKHHNKKECNIYLEFIVLNKNEIKLTIYDDGLGFVQKEDYNTLGLNLVKQFANKLDKSKIDFSSKNGTKFVLSFFATPQNSNIIDDNI